jgi:hypothetical protein
MTVSTANIMPTIAILASALKLEHMTDAAVQRAADNSLSHLATVPVYEFDGSELRIWSQSDAGVEYVTDGISCTCKGNRHNICKHRALYRLFLAREVLLDPQFVRAMVAEQTAPPKGFNDEPPPPEQPPIALNLSDDAADWSLG